MTGALRACLRAGGSAVVGLVAGLMVTVMPEGAQAEPTRLLWWSASVSEAKANSTDRRVLARILDGVDGGGSHAVTYEFATL